MKLILFSGIAIFILLSSCINGGTETLPQEYLEALQESECSEITEDRLFSGFKIGMNELQVDSVIKDMYDNGNLVYWKDIDKSYAPIRQRSDYTIDLSYYVYRYDGKVYYLSMSPKYIDGKLFELFCVIKNKKGYKSAKPLDILFSEYFENSERGKSFKKYSYNLTDNIRGTSYIKDNLEIMFYRQPDSEEGMILYRNRPDARRFYQAVQQKDSCQLNVL